MNSRFKNIYFWLGLIGIFFTATGVDFNTLTTWSLLLSSILDVLKNPVAVMSVIMAILGVFVDPSTPGIKDDIDKDIQIQKLREELDYLNEVK